MLPWALRACEGFPCTSQFLGDTVIFEQMINTVCNLNSQVEMCTEHAPPCFVVLTVIKLYKCRIPPIIA